MQRPAGGLQLPDHDRAREAAHAVWGHVRSLHVLFDEELRRLPEPAIWRNLDNEVRGLHGRIWPDVMHDHHDFVAAKSIGDLAAAELDGFADLIADSPGHTMAAPIWVEGLSRLDRERRLWSASAGPAFAAYAIYTAVDWIGLRCAVRSGAQPAAARTVVLGSFYGIFQPKSTSIEEALDRALEASGGRPVSEVKAPPLPPIAADAGSETQPEQPKSKARQFIPAGIQLGAKWQW
jgi:hypothetical protein